MSEPRTTSSGSWPILSSCDSLTPDVFHRAFPFAILESYETHIHNHHCARFTRAGCKLREAIRYVADLARGRARHAAREYRDGHSRYGYYWNNNLDANRYWLASEWYAAGLPDAYVTNTGDAISG